MKTPLLKRITHTALSLGILSTFCLISPLAFAEQSDTKAPPPPQAAAPMQKPAPGYTGVLWPYELLPPSPSAVATIDKNGAYYLPYLPWIGTNIGLLVNYADFFYQLQKANADGSNAAYKAPITAMANPASIENQQNILQNAVTQTTANINSLLTPDNSYNKQLYQLSTTPGTDITLPCSNGANCSTPDNKAFNADTLFGSTGYTADQQNSINQLIAFLGDMTDPLSSINLSNDPTKRNAQLQNADVQKSVLMMRTLAAAQSMALSNLNYLSQERQIIPGLGQKAGMTTLPTDGKEQPINDASQLQLEQFMINRRIGNKDWYLAANNATDGAIRRETLFVLAEMQQQLYQLKTLNERFLATMSVMEMQMTQFSKSNMQVQQQNTDESLNQ